MPVTTSFLAAASGLGLGLSLIIAIGAQNAFVLRQGLLGLHVRLVVTVCSMSDAVLIAAGVLGAGVVLTRVSWLLTVVRIAGSAFLLLYGLMALRRAIRPGVLQQDLDGGSSGRGATLATCLGLTWLNPHVYLDTVVLLGAIANTHHGQRWSFGAGAAMASVIWFVVLGYGARLLRPVFARRAAWRILDGLIAVVMVTLATVLATAPVT